jgi:hypothetical protein
MALILGQGGSTPQALHREDHGRLTVAIYAEHAAGGAGNLAYSARNAKVIQGPGGVAPLRWPAW